MHALMTCMKDEGPFALEFIAHHLVLGFDRIMVATNDCRDGTNVLLAALHDAGYVQHLDQVVAVGEAPQHAGYARLRRAFHLHQVEWLMMLDVDEFLFVSTGDGSVQALTASAPNEADIIALNSLTFAPNALDLWEPGRVCGRFNHRLKAKNKINGAIKSLTRNPRRFRHSHNHHMVDYRHETPLKAMRADGSLFDLDLKRPFWKQLRVAPVNLIRHELAHYNHYAVKTPDSFYFRQLRGNGAIAKGQSADERYCDDYFLAHMGPAVEDRRIDLYAAKVTAKMAEMLAHPPVAAAQLDTERRYLALIQPFR